MLIWMNLWIKICDTVPVATFQNLGCSRGRTARLLVVILLVTDTDIYSLMWLQDDFTRKIQPLAVVTQNT